MDNYALQAAQAKKRFLKYDQQALIEKLGLEADKDWLYTSLLRQPYRIDRRSGDMEKLEAGVWQEGNTHAEVMTLLDLICDSKEDRRLSGRYKSMTSFGLMFHRNLLEEKRDALADRIDAAPDGFRAVCEALGGVPFPGADIGCAVPFFDELSVAVQFWHGDDEFYPRLRYLWDENALQYLKYETMYFAVNLLKERLTLLLRRNGAE